MNRAERRRAERRRDAKLTRGSRPPVDDMDILVWLAADGWMEPIPGSEFPVLAPDLGIPMRMIDLVAKARASMVDAERGGRTSWQLALSMARNAPTPPLDRRVCVGAAMVALGYDREAMEWVLLEARLAVAETGGASVVLRLDPSGLRVAVLSRHDDISVDGIRARKDWRPVRFALEPAP